MAVSLFEWNCLVLHDMIVKSRSVAPKTDLIDS